jgi:hypothetical protein
MLFYVAYNSTLLRTVVPHVPTVPKDAYNWQLFFQGSSPQAVVTAPPGQLLSGCFRQVLHNASHSPIGHSTYEHDQAVPLSTLNHVQGVASLVGACVVRLASTASDTAVLHHRDPPLLASDEVCAHTDLIGRVFNRRMIPGRGLNIYQVCPNSAERWCSASEDNRARCANYRVHPLPLEVPIVMCFKNVYVTTHGHVFSGDYVLKPTGPCNPRVEAPLAATPPAQMDEVIVATAFWGDEFYHSLIENLPRLMAVWDELLRSPHIKVAAGTNKAMAAYMQYMGLSSDRIVHGNIWARVAYVPNPGGCGNSPGHRYVQALRARMHHALLKRHSDAELKQQRRILVIQRSGRMRVLSNHAELIGALTERFPSTPVLVFRDNPPPPLEETVRMFYSARVIIAPHGAGLSNIVLARQDAAVVEIMVAPVVTCYLDLARELGNEWRGVYGNAQSESAPMRVNVDEVVSIVSGMLK